VLGILGVTDPVCFLSLLEKTLPLRDVQWSCIHTVACITTTKKTCLPPTWTQSVAIDYNQYHQLTPPLCVLLRLLLCPQSVRTTGLCRVLTISRSAYNAVASDFPTSSSVVLDNLVARAEEVRCFRGSGRTCHGMQDSAI
jgi:hypothetical protein